MNHSRTARKWAENGRKCLDQSHFRKRQTIFKLSIIQWVSFEESLWHIIPWGTVSVSYYCSSGCELKGLQVWVWSYWAWIKPELPKGWTKLQIFSAWPDMSQFVACYFCSMIGHFSPSKYPSKYHLFYSSYLIIHDLLNFTSQSRKAHMKADQCQENAMYNWKPNTAAELRLQTVT